ncbi:hypothetical protein [Streptomyces spirodelae]|uniref:Uncharacterized protein n=1 Tax=Streptomyces spirodelae TaxID=2812904 RepID=A0ABS3WYW1_9ACTN|nr:hypothetical protein [Streptomyces spirodelae]MBO8188259.1 hypothetical protein [Streptomyces spirodelae]
MFLARTVKGDWLGALRVAGWPLALVFVAACAIGIWSNDEIDDLDIGWGTRMRVALAALLQGVGGGFGVSADAGTLTQGSRVAGDAELSGMPLLVTAVWIGALVVAARRERRRLATAPPSAGFEAALRIGAVCGLGGLALGLYASPSYEGLELESAPGLTLLWSFLLSTFVAAVVLGRGATDAWLAARPGPRVVVGALRTAGLALVCVSALAAVVMFIVLVSQDGADTGSVWALVALLPNVGAFGLALAWGAPTDIKWNVSELSSGRESFGYGELSDLADGWAVVGALAGGLACALLLGTLVARRSADRREQLLAAGLFVLGLLVIAGLAGAGYTADFRESTAAVHDGSSGLGSDYDGNYGEDYGDFGSGDRLYANGEVAIGIAELLLFALLWSYGGTLLVPFVRAQFGKGGPGGTGPGAYGAGAYGAGAYGAGTYGAGTYGGYGAGSYGPGSYAPTATGAPAAPAGPPPAPAPAPGQGDEPGAAYPATETGDGPEVLGPGGGGGPVPPPQRRRGLMWAGLVLAVFLVGGIAAGGAFYLAGDDGKSDSKSAAGKPTKGTTKDSSKKQQPADEEQQGPKPAPSDSFGAPVPDDDTGTGEDVGAGGSPGSPQTTELPEGFERMDDPKGFSVGVMEGWQRRTKGTQVDYEAPTGGDYLRIGIIENAGQSSYENFRTLENGARKRDGYRRLELTKNTFRGRPGARWEFVYTSDDSGRTIHAIDQAYVSEDGTEYSIYVENRYDEWDPDREQVFSTALSTWDEDGN